jgi:hypothetical protein
MKKNLYYKKIIMNVHKTNDIEGTQWYQLKRSNRFAVMESLDGNMDYSRTCEVSREYQYFSHRLS